MKTGESVTIARKRYTIHSMRPCTMERGKKMAKIRFADVPGDFLLRLKSHFPAIELHEEMGLGRLELEGRHILLFASGEVAVRAAKSEQDLIDTAEQFLDALKP